MLKFTALSFITLFIFLSCSPDLPVVPPINGVPTGELHPGKFVWRDLMTDDIPSVKKFYTFLCESLKQVPAK